MADHDAKRVRVAASEELNDLRATRASGFDVDAVEQRIQLLGRVNDAMLVTAPGWFDAGSLALHR